MCPKDQCMIAPFGPTAHASDGGAKLNAFRFVSTSTIHLSRWSVSLETARVDPTTPSPRGPDGSPYQPAERCHCEAIPASFQLTPPSSVKARLASPFSGC